MLVTLNSLYPWWMSWANRSQMKEWHFSCFWQHGKSLIYCLNECSLWKKMHDKGCKPTSNAMHSLNAFWWEEPQDKMRRALTPCAVLWRFHFLAWASLYIWTNTKVCPVNATKQKRGLNPSCWLSPDLTHKALHVHGDKTLHEVEAFCSQEFILCWCRARFSSSCNEMSFFCLFVTWQRPWWEAAQQLVGTFFFSVISVFGHLI